MAGALMIGPLRPSAIAQTAMPDVPVKAAFVANFAKFTEWPSLPPGARMVACVVGDDELAAALVATIRGQAINGRAIEVARPRDPAAWGACHLLFLAGGRPREPADSLAALRTHPILTIGDGKDFARSGGIIELYVQDGRMRFGINTAAVDRAGLRISSRLLGLATIIRGHDAQ